MVVFRYSTLVKKWLNLVFFFFVFSILSFAQTNNPVDKQMFFQRFTSEQGLSQNSIYAILQDKQGFMWFGTDEGLNRFDGYNFKVYKNIPTNKNSIASNKIYALFEDKKGELWIGTRQGLSKFDATRTNVTNYRHDSQNPKSLSNDIVKAIFQDHKGTLWIGTQGGGLNAFDTATETFTKYSFDQNSLDTISSNSVTEIFEDQNGTLWIGTDKGLNQFDSVGNKFISYHHNLQNGYSISDENVTTIFQKDVQHLWIGTHSGLNVFSLKEKTFTPLEITEKIIPNDSFITRIFADQTGLIWIGTNKGLYKLNTKNNEVDAYFNVLKDASSLSSNHVSEIYQDRSGALWFGTYFGGINRFDSLSKRFPSYLADLENISNLTKNIWTIYLDHLNTLWIGTNDGLIEMDRKTNKIEIYRHNPNDPNSLRSSHIDTLIEDKDGVLWVGSNGGGLHSFDRKTKKFTSYLPDSNNPFSITSNKIRAFYLDKEGNLWIGTLGGGLNRYDKDSGRFYSYRYNSNDPNSISSDLVRAFSEDKEGNLWVGTESGLNKFDKKSEKFTSYRQNPKDPFSIVSDFVTYLYTDNNNTLWAGTTAGLSHFENGKFSSITENDGLANNTINGILEDKKGWLWLSTNRGLTKYDPKSKTIKNFDTKDGLQCREFNGRACFQSLEGEMFFGGNNGFTSFYPEQIQENDYIPPVVITSLKLYDKVLEKANAWLTLGSKESNLPLMLSYQENFISFEFSALSYQLPERNQFAYMLEGIDEDWVLSQSRRYVSYSKIPPGEYTFKVKGSNSDGHWNQVPTLIHMTITPPFWQTSLAYIFYILLGSSIIYGAATYRLRIVNARNLLLEDTVAKRTAELASALSDIKKNNSQLVEAKEALEKNNYELDIKNKQLDDKNKQLDDKNKQLDEKIAELISAQQRADRIFSALAEVLPGTVLDGKYRLEQRLGAGGFGVVYRAVHLILECDVAVKIFKPVPGNDSEENLIRFKQEAISTYKVNHPNAITVLDSGISSEGIAYMVMELLKGSTLKAEIQRLGSLSVTRSAQILLPVCQALEKAHALGIIHRDIKPDNIFLHQENGKEIVKLLDFGIAKLMEREENLDDVSFTSKLIGTPAYISPERLTGMPYDGKADIYSLGVIFYEMLTGQLPFQKNSAGFLGLIQMHLTSKPPSVKSLKPEIPQKISDIVASLLEIEPAMRPTSSQLSQNLLEALSLSLEQLIDANGYSLLESIITTSNTKIGNTNDEVITIITSQPKDIDEQARIAKRIFISVINTPLEDRDKMLQQACGDNLTLYQQVRSLLLASQETSENTISNELIKNKGSKG